MSAEDRYRELAPLAALGALDGDDVVAFRRHLETCAECGAELLAYEQTAAALASSVNPVPPPVALRQQLMASVGAVPVMAPLPVSLTPAVKPRRTLPWFAAFATAAALLLAVVLASTRERLQVERKRADDATWQADQARRELADLQQALSEARSVRDLVVRPDSRLTILAGLQPAPGARARVFWNAGTREAVLIASGLERPAAGKAYEVWVIAPSMPPRPAGVFQPEPDGTALVQLPKVEETEWAQTFAVTVEPAGGSPAPTGPMVLAGAVQ